LPNCEPPMQLDSQPTRNIGTSTATTSALSILFVDDEPSILSSLKRLFRPKGYQIHLAEGGKAALELMEQMSVDLVISDMRMPEMDGVQLLEQVRQRWPDTVRLLLTGYADIASTIAAVNRGEIYRYISKPWDDADILLIVREALEHRTLELQNKRLEAVAQVQNEELKKAHAHLESLVALRTTELTSANGSLLTAHEKLKTNFITLIKVFSSLVELRGGNLAGHSRRVADLSRRMATNLGLESKQAHELFVAALLHEIGKVGFGDDMLTTAIVNLTPRQLDLYRRHPARAEQLLTPLPDLKGSTELIAAQLERFDGNGHPRRLVHDAIPLGARILVLASDYDNMLSGALTQRKLSEEEARALVEKNRGKRYDPKVVDSLLAMLDSIAMEAPHKAAVAERKVGVHELQAGMVLSRDLITPNGLMMLSAQHVLDDRMIHKIVGFEKSAELNLCAYVCVNQ
jgi:response regulator RpfG family c-di-GMP phosphodiesterase